MCTFPRVTQSQTRPEADAGTQCSGGHLEAGPSPFSAHRTGRLILLIIKVKKFHLDVIIKGNDRDTKGMKKLN